MNNRATVYCLAFLELRFFSSMFPSMLKEEIVSMNDDDDTTIGEYFEHCRTLTCCIHDFICHCCQHNKKFVKTDRVEDCDHCIMENSLIV